MSEFKFPTEVVELPSKGLVYPEGHILRSGKVEMKYMTAREEDILTNQNYINKGIVLDELVKSLIVSDVKYEDLVVGDKNAILVASRILGYGKDYSFSWGGEEYNIDLTTIENKPLKTELFNFHVNQLLINKPMLIYFNPPISIKFHLLYVLDDFTHRDHNLKSNNRFAFESRSTDEIFKLFNAEIQSEHASKSIRLVDQFSKSFAHSDRNRPIFELEAISVLHALDHFRRDIYQCKTKYYS